MADGEVGRLLTRLRRLGLQVIGTLAEVVVVQFLLKGLVGGLREHRLLLKDGQDTHGLCRGKRRDTRQKSAASRQPRVALNICIFLILIANERCTLNGDRVLIKVNFDKKKSVVCEIFRTELISVSNFAKNDVSLVD